MRYFITLILVASMSAPAFAETSKSTIDDQTKVEVTVYNSNIALIKDTRRVKVPKGEGELRFMDVASTIRPVTVHIKSLNQPKHLAILEQNYEYDLMNSQKLLDKFIGKTIKLRKYNAYTDKEEMVEAELLSNNSGQIYRINDEIHLGYNGYQILPEIPENLIAKPTLTWQYMNTSGKAHDVEVSYLANNIGWKADYILVINKDDTEAGLNGWVSLDNNSGTIYRNAKLKLVAGDVNRVSEASGFKRKAYMADHLAMASESAPQFVEQGFFEYHIYDLQRPTTLKNNQSKQISLLEADGVSIQKEFLVRGNRNYWSGRYGGQKIEPKVGVYIKFKNEKENNMGMPLPEGVMRLYKADSSDSLQFIGEDRIDHTPKDEEIELKVGDAFDVVAERVQKDYKILANNVYETEWELTLRNHKEEDIVVILEEPMYSDWNMIFSSHEHIKKDAFTVQIPVRVKADEEVKVKYRVRVRTS